MLCARGLLLARLWEEENVQSSILPRRLPRGGDFTGLGDVEVWGVAFAGSAARSLKSESQDNTRK